MSISQDPLYRRLALYLLVTIRDTAVLFALCPMIDDSYQGSIIKWSYDQTKYSGGEIIETMNKSWFNT